MCNSYTWDGDMPPTLRRFLSHIDAGGRVVIIRSDGEPFTPEQKAWLDDTVTKKLRSDLMAGYKGTYPDQVLHEPDVMYRDRPDGTRHYVHPLMHRLKSVINLKGWSYASLSEHLGRHKGLVSRYIRGENDPHLKDAAAVFGLVGYKLLAVPVEVVDQVNEIVSAQEEKVAHDLMQHSMGDAGTE